MLRRITRRLPTVFSSMLVRRATPLVRAGSAKNSTGGCSNGLKPVSLSCSRAASTRTTWARRWRSHGPRASTSRPGSNARPARRTLTRSAPLFVQRAKLGRASLAPNKRASQERAEQAEYLPCRPRRARPFRAVRRTLRRRDLDAVDPAAGAGVRRRQSRSRITKGDGRLSHALRRPPFPALFRRAVDGALP